MLRQPKNIIVFPYYYNTDDILFALFKRADLDCWQGIAGGVEEGENILEAAKRESYEEAEINTNSNFIKLDSKTSIPREWFKENWDDNVFVVTEYSFGVEVKNQDLSLSNKHKKFGWFSYEEAMDKLKWDSNKTALWELNKRLKINIHKMHLYNEPFELIKSGKKKIEVRLNDEKRQRIKMGDVIVFSKLPDSNEKIKVKVTGLLHYATFREFYTDIPFELFGREDKTLDWMLKGTYEIYNKKREEKYGVLGIKIKMILVYSV